MPTCPPHVGHAFKSDEAAAGRAYRVGLSQVGPRFERQREGAEPAGVGETVSLGYYTRASLSGRRFRGERSSWALASVSSLSGKKPRYEFQEEGQVKVACDEPISICADEFHGRYGYLPCGALDDVRL